MSRLKRSVEPAQPSATPQFGHLVAAPAFQLLTFSAMVCYIEMLVSRGQSLTGALTATLCAAVGTWLSTSAGHGAVARARV